MRRTWLMPFQVEKTRLNGKYFSIWAAGIFTPNPSVMSNRDIYSHDSPPSRPKFPSTAVVPMASCSKESLINLDRTPPSMQGVELPCFGPRFLKIKPQATVRGALAGCCARRGHHTWAMCGIHPHNIPLEGIIGSLNDFSCPDCRWWIIIPHDLGWSCPYPRKGTWQKYAEIDSNSTCFHARILPAAPFQRQKTHWCPACHQRFELRRATDPGTKIWSKPVQQRSTPLSFSRNWPNFCVTSTLHMISLKCSTFASTWCQDVQESDKRAMEGKGGRDQKLGWFWRAFKFLGLSSPKSARELLWQACNLPRHHSEVTSSLHAFAMSLSLCLPGLVPRTVSKQPQRQAPWRPHSSLSQDWQLMKLGWDPHYSLYMHTGSIVMCPIKYLKEQILLGAIKGHAQNRLAPSKLTCWDSSAWGQEFEWSGLNHWKRE